MEKDPIAALKEEVLAEAEKLSSRSFTEAERDCIEGLIPDIVRFAHHLTSNEVMERIYIEKEAKWVPIKGDSLKPGNLRLNLGKLFEAIVSGVGVYYTALANPLFAIFTGLVAFRSLVKAAKVELSQDDAFVMWGAWTCEQRGQPVTVENVQKAIDAEKARVGHPGDYTVEQILNSLERLGEIGAVRKSNNEWQMTEPVVVKT